MCTVSIYSLSKDNFILTTNRDEHVIRPTSLPEIFSVKGINILFPKDLDKGGSWIAAGNNGRIACLLNGAFEPHVRNPPYRESRGQVLIQSFGFNDLQEFFNSYDFSGIEPFTLLIGEMKNSIFSLYELRWDFKRMHLELIDLNEPKLWCSAPLYTKSVQIERKEFFRKWNAEHEINTENILAFHNSNKESNGCDIILKGKYGLQTVSITQVELNPHMINMKYFDRLNNQTSVDQLEF